MFSLKNVTKEYKHSTGNIFALKNISFTVKKGEVICVLGKSGSGKSTLLRVLSGLEEVDSGSVKFKKKKHEYSYVSQAYTLWPHMTVLENLILAPSLFHPENQEEIKKEALELLHRFGLSDYRDAYPSDLSGGQRQRVAILRAIMTKPEILFLDEITSALDPELTKSVLDLIRALAKDGYTMVIVSHHMSFAMSVSDRVLFLKDGELLADQDSANFFINQKNKEIQSFILDIAKKDESIQVFKGIEQFQAYHLGLMRRLPEGSTVYVAGAVGDQWYKPMGDFYPVYEKMRHLKNITWKMVMYEEGETEKRLVQDNPTLNQFRKMPRSIQNPANYNVFGDTVITQIFEDEPTIIEVKNKNIAEAYLRFFEELWVVAN
jgi:polar amino acid transport system ATP-binding protein